MTEEGHCGPMIDCLFMSVRANIIGFDFWTVFDTWNELNRAILFTSALSFHDFDYCYGGRYNIVVWYFSHGHWILSSIARYGSYCPSSGYVKIRQDGTAPSQDDISSVLDAMLVGDQSCSSKGRWLVNLK